MVGRRRGRPASRHSNHSGSHFLRPDIAAAIVADARVGGADLVLDLGAGWGALTSPLALTGARVIAVERDPDRWRRLAERYSAHPAVTVICADIRTVALPRRPFRVVANIPFAVTSATLHRLLDPPGSGLVAADLVVQRAAAARFVAWSQSAAGAWWGVRYTLRRGRPLAPECFHPPPSVEASVLVVRRRPLTGASEAQLAGLLREVRRDPGRRARSLLGPHRTRLAGVEPSTPVGRLETRHWRAIFDAGGQTEGPSRAARASR